MGQPDSLPENEEAAILNQKGLAEDAYNIVTKNKELRKQQDSNLTPQERLGRQEISQGIRLQGWHLSKTDK